LREQFRGGRGRHGVFPQPARGQPIRGQIALADLLHRREPDQPEDLRQPEPAHRDVERVVRPRTPNSTLLLMRTT